MLHDQIYITGQVSWGSQRTQWTICFMLEVMTLSVHGESSPIADMLSLSTMNIPVVQLPVGIVLRHSKEPVDAAQSKSDIYFDIMKIKSPDRSLSRLKQMRSVDEEEEGGEGAGKVSKALKLVWCVLLDLTDDLSGWLEERSSLYREVVQSVKDEDERAERASSEEPKSPAPEEAGDDGGGGGATEKRSGKPEATPAAGGVGFDARGELLQKQLHLEPSPEQRKETEAYEADLRDQASHYTKRFKRLGIALYYVFLSQNAYVPFFFILLNVVINGSLLSLVYAILLFGWGLLSIPWPSKRFWLGLIFYTMSVLVVKYSFQFQEVDYWSENFSPESGLYPPRLIGIDKKGDFVSNAVIDILLLIFLLIHRGLLFVRFLRTIYCHLAQFCFSPPPAIWSVEKLILSQFYKIQVLLPKSFFLAQFKALVTLHFQKIHLYLYTSLFL